MSHAVIIKNAVKKYGDFTAVNGISLNIEQGEFFTLLGPSGCGKTTLLRMIAGFNTVDGGEICFDEQVINNLPAHKRDIGMVFQNYAIFPHLNVADNVAYGLKARKVPKAEIIPRVEEALKMVQIDQLKTRQPNELSGGQQQRVALARALVMEPKVLLLDEPLSNLDAKLRVETRQQIRRLQQSLGITAVFVTHDQEEAMSMGDKIAILKLGALQQLGSPMELYRNPANSFVAGFLGTPAMNFMEAVSRGGQVTLGGVVLSGLPSVPDGTYTLGIRPEDLVLENNGQMEPLQGTVESVELLGDHALVYLRWADKAICCRTGIPDHLSEGDTVPITLDLSRVKLFDPSTGAAL